MPAARERAAALRLRADALRKIRRTQSEDQPESGVVLERRVMVASTLLGTALPRAGVEMLAPQA